MNFNERINYFCSLCHIRNNCIAPLIGYSTGAVCSKVATTLFVLIQIGL